MGGSDADVTDEGVTTASLQMHQPASAYNPQPANACQMLLVIAVVL